MKDLSIFQGIKELKARRHFMFEDLGGVWCVSVLEGDAFLQCGFLEKKSRESNKALYERAYYKFFVNVNLYGEEEA